MGSAGGSAFDVAANKRTQAAKLLAEVNKLTAEADAWEQGAAGEQDTALELATLGPHYTALHDLRIAGSKANVDHVVIGPTGVFVIDSKNHTGKITFSKGTLWSGKYPQTWKLDALRFEARHIRLRVGRPVSTIMCFVSGQLAQDPIIIDDIHVTSIGKLRNTIRSMPVIMSEAEAMVAISALQTPEQRRANQAAMEADRKQSALASATGTTAGTMLAGPASAQGMVAKETAAPPVPYGRRKWFKRIVLVILGLTAFGRVLALFPEPPATPPQVPAPTVATQPAPTPALSTETPFATTATMAP